MKKNHRRRPELALYYSVVSERIKIPFLSYVRFNYTKLGSFCHLRKPRNPFTLHIYE